MTKLEELIKELCPKGVEYREFLDVCYYIRGITYSKYDEIGQKGINGVFVLRANNIQLESNTLALTDLKLVSSTVKISKKQWLKKDDILICAGSGSKEHIGKVAYIFEDMPYTFGGFMGVIRPKSDNVLPIFVFHVLTGSSFKKHLRKVSESNSSTINNINNDTWTNWLIPVPPLPVQREIVRILDKFTELTAELTAELAARKKQYEYYRNSIILLTKNGVRMSLKDIANTFRGEYITKNNAKVGNIPVILGGKEPAYYIDKYNHGGEIVVVARSGASAGFVSYWNEQIFVTDGFGYEAKKGIIIPKYLYYILKNIESKLNSMKRGAGVPHISGEALSNLEFVIPPLEEQERIVAILDRFDALCNDITSGLPAEIEARQKQYEYYRDKLLTFS